MKFIDRSIPEFLDINIQVDMKKIIEFSILLYKLGVEILEIDSRCLNYINRFPSSLQYIFRVKNEEDLELVQFNRIKGLLISVKDNSYAKQFSLISSISKKINGNKDIKIILEVTGRNINDLENYFGYPEGNLLFHANVLRIVGFSTCISEDLKTWIEKIKKMYEVEIDICAENNHFCATGVAVDAMNDGVDYITGTFGGIGGEGGYTPLEEVLLAAFVINNMEIKGSTDILQHIKSIVEEITGAMVPKDKPIIGEDIFLCGSGVHVDGIMKNPKNYEPFEPEIVGLRRRIVLGKHSGVSAVEWLLDESNINYDKKDVPRILEFIQQKSMELKSYFGGEDLRVLINELGIC